MRPASAAGSGTRLTNRDLVRMFLRERGGEEFYVELAQRAVDSLPVVVAGSRVLDLGCGPGHYSRALATAGASVVATDLDIGEIPTGGDLPFLQSDARSLPFGDGEFDGVFCSNVLEHTPEPYAVLDEIQRVLRPGGWAYVSWTNWYSPWGGHAIAPFHYLGPERGLRAYRRVWGEPRGRNLPYDGVWPTTIGGTLRHVAGRPGMRLDAVLPRYYPWLRPIMRVPGLREVAAWNCLLLLTRVEPSH